MNLNALTTFLAIVECGSLVKASQKLNVTQSTVTARLKQLEGDLGQVLVTRQKSGVKLTAPGYKFLRYAEVMTGIWQQARQETALPEGVSGLCNLGCEIDLWDKIGKQLVDQIHHEQSNTAMTVWPGGNAEIDRWFETGFVDAALTYNSAQGVGQRVFPIASERLYLYSTRADGPVRFDPGYVFVDYGVSFRRDHAEAYSDADTAKNSFGCAKWALDYLLKQGGSAYFPDWLVASHVQAKQLFLLQSAVAFEREVFLTVNTNASLSWAWLPDMVEAIVSEKEAT